CVYATPDHPVIFAALLEAAAVGEGFAVVGGADADAALGKHRAQPAEAHPGRPELRQQALFGDAVIRNVAIRPRRAWQCCEAGGKHAAKCDGPQTSACQQQWPHLWSLHSSAPQLAFSLTSVRSAPGLLDGQAPWNFCYVITSYLPCTGNRSSDLLRVGRRRDAGGLVLLFHLVRIVQAVRAFELDGLQIESGYGALDLLRLIEQAVHDFLHGGVAHLIPLADHLVVGLDHDAAAVELAHVVHGELDLGPDRVIDLRRLRLDQVRHARALHHRAVHPAIAADIDVADAERVEIVRGESVVGEAIMLLLGIVDHQPEFHALAGKLAIRETAEPGRDRGEAGLGRAVLDGLAHLAAGGPLRCHPGKVVDQQIGGGVEILRAAVAMAASAFLDVVVARRAIAVAWSGTVQTLPPEQNLGGVIAGGDISLDAASLLELVGKQLLGDLRRVQLLAADS